MFITPRTYSASQTPDRVSISLSGSTQPKFRSLTGWHSDTPDARPSTEMLLTRQAGSVRVGEVVRYTLTYTPTLDNDGQPLPNSLYVRVKNTSAIPLRAAYLHGPYTLYTSCYPSSFDPNTKSDFIPQFEPYLKAGGSWDAVIPISTHTREYQDSPTSPSSAACQNVTWIIEIVSQVVFSNTASVNFEILIGSDERSIDMFSSNGSSGNPRPANLCDHWASGTKGKQVVATKGVFSESITLRIDDTASLWNTPHLPSFDYEEETETRNLPRRRSVTDCTSTSESVKVDSSPDKTQTYPRKRIHLVVLTHGLHSNLGADMLYLKESIDAAAAAKRAKREQEPRNTQETAQSSSKSCFMEGDSSHDKDEQVIVRGFPGNAARTERGIQYLGKRLAKYVLLMTYPDQPHLPRKKTKAKTFSGPFAAWKGTTKEASKHHSTSCSDPEPLNLNRNHPYQITSISFIGHSLGGLVQTYAIAYIQKYSPDFFDKIRPINFIALATPFLGLSHENPMYVRFALDFGLVGRTGQDLGLSWTAPRLRTGWESIIGGKGNSPRPKGRTEAGAKPLLRILPSGPAHEVLTKFMHRTVYSNLVNDGIVPLRTSCLLFLDWKGLDRVEKARRENGIVGTVAEWGWAELTGANSKTPRPSRPATDLEVTDTIQSITGTIEETSIITVSHQMAAACPSSSSVNKQPSNGTECRPGLDRTLKKTETSEHVPEPPFSPLSGFFSILRLQEPTGTGHKQAKILKRSQTLAPSSSPNLISSDTPCYDNSHDYGFHSPPKTTLFESASDLLMPPLPPTEFIIDPTSRPRTIFHDRIYYPEDIPPPVIKRKTFTSGFFHDQSSRAQHSPAGDFLNETGLKVEEKIARAYHRKLSWRKVLVRLEPDAHNNIIVRRMFTNAYGWPVVKHLADSHFGLRPLTSSEEA